MLRTLDPMLDDFAALPYEGLLGRLNKQLIKMRALLKKGVAFVKERRDSEYQAFVARHLVAMEIDIFVGYLMIRDALKDSAREPLAEQFIVNAAPMVETACKIVVSGDTTTIDKHKDIIDY